MSAAQYWYDKAPAKSAYDISDHIRQSFWRNGLGSAWFQVTRAEAPYAALGRWQQAAHVKATTQVLGVASQQQGRRAHVPRSTVVAISVVTAVMSLCTGHLWATASSSLICASVRSPVMRSVAFRR